MLSLPEVLNSYGIQAAVKTDLFIGGAWRPGAEGKRIDVLDPSTGKAIATVADATVEDGLAAVTVAHDALPTVANQRCAGA